MSDVNLKIYPTYEHAMRDRGTYGVEEDVNIPLTMFLASQDFVRELYNAVSNNKRILIDEDCDPDGYLAGRAIKDTLDHIGYKNYYIEKHAAKRHKIDMAYLNSIVERRFDMVIIVDSSTNDMEALQFMSDQGIKVLIADHHNTNYIFSDYPENVVIVNPQIDIKFKPVVYNALSGCAVTVFLMEYFLSKYFNTDLQSLYILAYITLYSDSCDMSQEYCRYVVTKCLNATEGGPEIVKLLMNPRYDFLNRNFISWKLVPRINALLRANEFEFVHDVLHNDEWVRQNSTSILEHIEEVYSKQRASVSECVQFCIDAIDHTQMTFKTLALKNIVCTLIPPEYANRYRNSTGMIANQIASELKRACICIVDTGESEYEGSVRDHANRNILDVFKKYTYAEGHGPAFGVRFDRRELHDIITSLDVDLEGVPVPEKSIFIDWQMCIGAQYDEYGRSPEELAVFNSVDAINVDALKIGRYNEISGHSLPKIQCIITLSKAMSKYIKNGQRKSVVKLTADSSLVAFGDQFQTGDVMLTTPMLKGKSVEFVVDEFLGNVYN